MGDTHDLEENKTCLPFYQTLKMQARVCADLGIHIF